MLALLATTSMCKSQNILKGTYLLTVETDGGLPVGTFTLSSPEKFIEFSIKDSVCLSKQGQCFFLKKLYFPDFEHFLATCENGYLLSSYKITEYIVNLSQREYVRLTSKYSKLYSDLRKKISISKKYASAFNEIYEGYVINVVKVKINLCNSNNPSADTDHVGVAFSLKKLRRLRKVERLKLKKILHNLHFEFVDTE